MRIREIVNALEQFAPLPLQDGFDNAGMQLGLTDAETTGALLCLDVTEPVVNEAIALRCNLIISHHPLLFHGVKSITGHNYVERCILKAIRNDIAIYSAHTNLDNAQGGVNYKIADKLGLKNIRFLVSKPTTITGHLTDSGSGVIGELPQEEHEMDFLHRIKRAFDVPCVRYNRCETDKPIRTVALCGGAGAFLIPDAIANGADAFLTGEIRYHEYFGREQEILLVEIGHYESEQYTREILFNYLDATCPGLKIYQTNVNTNPINYL
ncbi:MAG: Nif3-like dinuclear metal center hexameric protein [Prevotellaceae bacterium]|jgi:dinuclear metal center YbgI/SA1388 family protein|nr:Nif3-like dinuclear metal center hexameric protein [Prevotellaceae bacterium]